MTVRVKVCGITRIEDMATCAYAGADAIGLVFYPSSSRYVAIDRAQTIVSNLPPFVTRVGLFVNPTVDVVETVLAALHLDLLQFHGDEPAEFCDRFGIPYLKAVRVQPGLDLVQYAARYRRAQGLLLDAFVAGAPGGTGQTFDWALIPPELPLPVVLSGGLTPDNVSKAIETVKPWAVDVSSGVEMAKGIKDAAKIAAFMQGVCHARL